MTLTLGNRRSSKSFFAFGLWVCVLQLLWVVVLLPSKLWWLWVKRKRRRGMGEIGSEEGDLYWFMGMVGFD